MKTVRTVIPPRLVLAQSTIYAHQGSIYALDAKSGMLLQNYHVQGSAYSTVVNDILYVNVYHHPNHTVQARHCRDGSLLWSFATESHPIDAPVVANGMVYVACSENVIYALQAANGTLVWKISLKYDSGLPSTSGPFVCTAPTHVDGVLYLAHAANFPQKAYLYAFRGQDGTQMWKTQMMALPGLPLQSVLLTLHADCSPVALKGAHSSCYLPLASARGKLGQYSNKSDPIIEN